MTEKEMFLNSYEREFGITMNFLDAYPSDNLDLRPGPRLQTAKEVAWNFPEEDRLLVRGAIEGDVAFKENAAPDTIEEIKRIYGENHHALVERIKELPDTAFDEMITFGSGSENAKEMRRGDALWLAIMDAAHHRGQFSVYIRLAGGKVPPLYSASGETGGEK